MDWNGIVNYPEFWRGTLMTDPILKLEELFVLRQKERNDKQDKYTQELIEKVDSLLGSRLVLALDQMGAVPWRVENTKAMREFDFRGGKFNLVVNTSLDSQSTDVEIQTIEPQFEKLIKKANINAVCEDWFFNSIETISFELKNRIKT
jgi:hypothetical protein